MKRSALALFALATPAHAHEGILTHTHPHADYGLALLGVVAIFAVAALVSWPRLKEIAARKRHRDPR